MVKQPRFQTIKHQLKNYQLAPRRAQSNRYPDSGIKPFPAFPFLMKQWHWEL